MRWLTRDLWKAGIAMAGILLLLVLTVGLPVSAASAHERAPGLATRVTVQTTPTEDATVTELNKEKLAQEVQQLKNQNEPDPIGWLRTNVSILLSTLVVVIGGLFGLGRWLGDRRNEREKRVEELFQAAVTGLGDEKEGAKIGAAILLRTFLHPGYERYYTQVFDLAVAHLRLPRTPKPPEDLDPPQQLTPLSRALIVVFKEAFPCARSQNKGWSQSLKRTDIQTRFKLTGIQSLDASGIQLDYANLAEADLSQVWMCQASLRKTDLTGANLSGAYLWKTNLSGAYLWKTNLSGANLLEANLCKADLSETDLEDALSLKDTDSRGVKGLTKEQLVTCKAKGAIIDEDPTISSSQSTVSPPLPSQSNDIQATLAPSAQGSTPTSDADGSSATSSKSGPES
jgi:Pentapeptide repeats (8 copies)